MKAMERGELEVSVRGLGEHGAWQWRSCVCGSV
jgi:hypothetical protein